MSDSEDNFHGFHPSEIEGPLSIDLETLEIVRLKKPRGRPKGSDKSKSEEVFHGFTEVKAASPKICLTEDKEGNVVAHREKPKPGRPKKVSEEPRLESLMEAILTDIIGDIVENDEEPTKTPSKITTVKRGTSSRPKFFLLENTSSNLSYAKLPKSGPVLHR